MMLNQPFELACYTYGKVNANFGIKSHLILPPGYNVQACIPIPGFTKILLGFGPFDGELFFSAAILQ
jgi:hypothetical protein